MSKLVTDSKALMDLLFSGTSSNDTPIHSLIDGLKEATLKCAELRACMKWMDEGVVGEHLDVINTALVESWQQMLELQNEFKDLAEKHFQE